MPTEEAEFEIGANAPATVTQEFTIVPAGQIGTPSALRTMTHPNSSVFPVVTYNLNPTRTINYDQQPLPTPSSDTLRTLGTTQAFVTPNELDDTVVTERWEAAGGNASMVAAQFRRMYELVVNPPAPESPEVFIQWAPLDRGPDSYNVIILDIRVGGGSGQLDMKEIGSFPAGALDAVATGLVDRVVEWDFLLVSVVVP